MSHSREQMRKKEEAMKEAMEHKNHSNIANKRGGKDHEDHKNGDMDRGTDAGDMGQSDKFSLGY